MVFLNNVYTAFSQVLILFIIAGVGFICHKKGIYTEKASRLSTDLLFYIVAPAVIVRSFLSVPYNKSTLRGLLLAGLGGVFFHLVGIAFSELLFRKNPDEKTCIFKYACIYGNVGYMALPLAQAIIGDEGVFYCSAIFVPFNILSFTHGVKIMENKKDSSPKNSFKRLVFNPGVMGVALGLPLFISGISLPQVIYSPISLLADLNTPLAMIMFGTYLASVDWKTLFSDKRIFTVALVKIILMPLITIGVLKAVGYKGALLVACVLSSSSPTANNTVMFSAKFNRDTALASKITAFISVLSVLTMPVMIAIAQSL